MKPPSHPKEACSQKLAGRLAIMAALAGPACTIHQEIPASAPSDTDTHQEVARTRNYTKLPPNHSESGEIAKEAVAMQGYLSPTEVTRMQTVHEDLYEQYLNPGMMHHLIQTGQTNATYAALNLVLQYPYAFEYQEKKYGRVEIVKRRPYTEENEDIPDSFKVVIETRGGYLTEAGGLDLTGAKGTPPWMEHKEYNRQMVHYRARFENAYQQHGDWDTYYDVDENWPEPQRMQKLLDLLVAPYEKIVPEMQIIYKVENVDFPRRLVQLIEARQLGFEINDPRFRDLKYHQEHQGTTYEEITRQRYEPHNKLQLVVIADPEMEGIYAIYTRGNYEGEPLRVTRQGYMLTRNQEGNWVIDPRYTDAVKRKYYREHPNAPQQTP